MKPLKKKKQSLFFSTSSIIFVGLFADLLLFYILNVLNIEVGIFPSEITNSMLTLTIIFFISIAVGSFFSVLLTKKMIKPIEELKEATNEIAKGNFDIKINPSNIETFDELISNFNEMLKELKSIETLKSSFISDVSHDFKTPLSIIQSYSKTLRKPNLDPETRKKYEDILDHNIRKLNNLTTNILNLSKLENQQTIIDKETFLLDEQIRQCIIALEPKWSQKNIDFELNLNKIDFFWSKSLMESVWTNLIGNAIKFSNKNGKIKIDLKAEENNIIFKIEDNGIGMDEETQKYIFNKFYQGDTSRTSSGNGLGLTIVNKILNFCNGKIEVFSEVKKGTCFTVTLPKLIK